MEAVLGVNSEEVKRNYVLQMSLMYLLFCRQCKSAQHYSARERHGEVCMLRASLQRQHPQWNDMERSSSLSSSKDNMMDGCLFLRQEKGYAGWWIHFTEIKMLKC